MPLSETRLRVAQHASTLGAPLFAAMGFALAQAAPRMKGIDRMEYPHIFPMLVRADAREFLKTSPLPVGWEVGGDPRKMGQLEFINHDDAVRMRFLKESKSANGVPHAGRNRARRVIWQQLPFDVESRLESDMLNLLFLWKEAGEGVALRIVHPVEPGNYMGRVQCDLDLQLVPGVNMYDALSFKSSEEDTDLFDVDVEDDLEDEV